MSEQLLLPIAGQPPRISPADLAAVESFLRGRGWVKAKDFPRIWTERKIRALANASEGRIISGQRGYRLTREATIEEVRQASTWLRHQAEEMRRRALEIDRIYFRQS